MNAIERVAAYFHSDVLIDGKPYHGHVLTPGGGVSESTVETDARAALADLEALVQAAEKVDDLSGAIPLDANAVWDACEEMHDILRRVKGDTT